ncbi:MAG: DMT family protein [Lentisphaeria bacterium]|nr:DMT family protein [Lentisphaeria bacterium]
MSQIFFSAAFWKTACLLVLSNCFMTYAWYGHLKTLSGKPMILAILISWGVAFFEYLIQVPANRIGHAGNISLAQLKIMQEVIALSVFIPFSLLYMKEPVKLNFLWAALCMLGAVYFIFKD